MMNKKIKIFSTLIFCLLLNFSSNAQSSYANVKVDELSDAKILEIIKSAEGMGFTSEAQLEQLVLTRGMNSEEVQKFKLRATKLRSQGAKTNSAVVTGRELSESTSGEIANERKVTDAEIRPKIFGSDLFRNGNITFEPNLRIATPQGYVIGPDDKLIIDINGDNEASYNPSVTTEGVISLPYVGRIAVGGLTISQATSKIKAAMSKTYAALNSGRTTLAVNLGNIRSIKVTITGQVTKSGTYTVPSLSTIYNALNYSGGPSQNGTYRNIQLIRNNKVIATIDVYDFILKGIQQGNVRLQDQDVINIPVYQKRVEIVGEVKQSYLFEVNNNETLQDVINFAGGFTTQAYIAKIKAFQNTDRERKIIDIQSAEFNNYSPQNGDKYIVEPILDRFLNRVEIIGSVFRAGQFELEKGLTLKGLINKADGVTEDAFLNRGYINRLNPDNSSQLIYFDVAQILAGTTLDILLQREDKVTINSIFDLRDEYKVSIQGQVRFPGVFDYATNLTLESIVQLAGGLKEGASPNRIEISRRIKNGDVNSKTAPISQILTVAIDKDLKILGDTIILQPFDIVNIRSAEGYETQKQVKIEGEVLHPGFYTISNKDERISDLIQRAGGLTISAYVDGASLKRPGAEKVNPNDRNAINKQEEESKKLLNLKRQQEDGVKDTLSIAVAERLIQSDLVGIDLEDILKNPKSKYDLLLEEGDVVRIPRQLQIVKINGEVLNPNSIIYRSGKGLKQYINGAGGFSSSARKNGVWVQYANGSVATVGRFIFFNNYPEIKPGSEIMVPKRAERERISPQAWIGIGTALASLGAIIVSLLR
jgi:protein involved in polysaccharide export with SLBB domain